MKKLYILLLVLMGVSAFAQKQKFIIVKTYKGGKATVSKIIPINVAPPIAIIKPAKPKLIVKTKVKYVSRVDTIYKHIVETEIPVVDTAIIVSKYQAVVTKKDKLVLADGQGTVTIEDKIAGNKFIYRTWLADINPRVVKEVKEVEAKPKNSLYLGPNLISTPSRINHALGLSVLFKNKYNEIYHIGGGMIMRDGIIDPTPYINLGWYIKIK